MKKKIVFSKEQARMLYNLLSNHEVPNRSDNRKRFLFLKVIEAWVFEFDDLVDKIRSQKKKTIKELSDEILEAGKETKAFIFKDREVFARVKDMFEKLYEVGTISRDERGATKRGPLIGRDAKLYMELEDSFADVAEIKEKK